MKRFIPTIIGLIAMAVMMPSSAFAVGLGISPSNIQVDNLVRGASAERTIVLSRSDASEEISFEVQGEGEISEWVSTNHGDSFTIPKGEQRFPVEVEVSIPEDAANGEYKGNVRFIAQTKEAEGAAGNDVAVSVNAVLRLTLDITGDQLVAFDVTSVEIPPLEEGWPVQVVMQVENKGNVAAAPDRVDIEFWDKFKERQLAAEEISDMRDFSSVRAFETGDFVLTHAQDLALGQYWAKVRAYYEDELKIEKEVIFDVVEAGSLDKSAQILSTSVSNEAPEVGELVKIEAEVENTGTANLIANLVVEVSQDGKLIEMIEGDAVGIRINSSEKLSAFFTPEEKAKYDIEVYAKFAGKQTTSEMITLDLAGLSMGIYYVLAGSGGLVVLISFAIFGLMHHKPKGKKGAKKKKK